MVKNNKTNRYSLNYTNAHPMILEFCHAQSNFSDTVKYLIEKEIIANGIRNLQEYIPPSRPIPEIPKKVSIEEAPKEESIEITKEESVEEVHKEKSIEEVLEQYKDVIEKAKDLGFKVTNKKSSGCRIGKYNWKSEYWNDIYEGYTEIEDGNSLEKYIKENMVLQ